MISEPERMCLCLFSMPTRNFLFRFRLYPQAYTEFSHYDLVHLLIYLIIQVLFPYNFFERAHRCTPRKVTPVQKAKQPS
jgi:hypothetical protein